MISKGKAVMAMKISWRTILVLLTVFIGGCAAENGKANHSSNQSAMDAILPQREIDERVGGFADTFLTRVAEPYGRIIATAKTPQVRTWALQTRLGQALGALTDATGPNPSANLIDIVVMVTLQRMSIEEHWIPTLLHDDGNDLLDAYKESEKNAWKLADLTFTDQQVTDLRNAIVKWKRENPGFHYTAYVRFTDFVSSAPTSKNNSLSLPSSLLGMLNIDPLQGLDPVTEEAERIRMLSERLLFVGMRLPIIMNWQIEAATDQVMNNPSIQNVIATSAHYAKLGDRFDDIVSKYPSDFAQITKVAIEQINAAATEQRQAITTEVNAQSEQVHGILADARNSIVLARDATASMNTSTAKTISEAENSSQRILHQAMTVAIVVIIIGFLWPALVIFGYRYAARRWLGPRDQHHMPHEMQRKQPLI
jgi:hypothetical protein